MTSHVEFDEHERLEALHQLEALNQAVNRALQAQGVTEAQVMAQLERAMDEVFAECYELADEPKQHKTHG